MQINNFCNASISLSNSIIIFTTKEQLLEVIKVYSTEIKNLQEIINNFAFSAKFKEILDIKGAIGKNFIIIGLGEQKKLSKLMCNNVGGFAASVVAKETEVYIKHFIESDQHIINEIIIGFIIKGYGFDKHITTAKNKSSYSTSTINLIDCAVDNNEINAIVSSINLAKDLVNQPANIAHPQFIVNEIKKLEKLGIKVTILNKQDIIKKQMNLFLSVGDGSDKDSYIAIMEYNNNSQQKQPLAIVGKGVTFDSGGYSLKPAAGMMDMKKDMSGAATTIGLLSLLASRKAKVNVVGVVGLVENLVNGNATKPGDIVTSMQGSTVEILNTDAEGRLVLADLLYMCSVEYNPKEMINLATLTGAIIVSLGSERAGLFSNNNTLSNNLFNCGEETGELLWNMPLGAEYEKHLKSSVADLQNISTAPKVAGSIFGAMFLKHFVNNTPWAHLDIAGVADLTATSDLHQKGAKAFGIRLLDTFIKKHYEA